MFSFRPGFRYIVKDERPCYNNWGLSVTSRNGKYVGLRADSGELRAFIAKRDTGIKGHPEYITIEIGDDIIRLSSLDMANNSGSRFL